MKQALTTSRLACFRACPRRHWMRYELGLQPAEKSQALKVGSGFHAALEAADKGENVDAAICEHVEDPFDLALVAAMFDAHQRRWADDPLEVVETELEFDLPLVNPETGAASRIWRDCGKIDRIVRLADGRMAIQEYKTTTRDFSPGSEYWTKLRLDEQLSRYVIAARELGYPIETVLYDVTRRPALRPLKATPEDKRKYTKDGRLYANQRDSDETPEEFAARVAEAIAQAPDQYFARIEIARLEQDLEDCRRAVWQQQLAIRAAQRLGHWYRNPARCFDPFPCEYLAICGDRDLEERTPAGFIRSEDIHPELTGNATVGGEPDHATAPGLAGAQQVR